MFIRDIMFIKMKKRDGRIYLYIYKTLKTPKEENIKIDQIFPKKDMHDHARLRTRPCFYPVLLSYGISTTYMAKPHGNNSPYMGLIKPLHICNNCFIST